MAVAHKGSISMGMVLIPIGLYKTTVDNDIHFNQLEKESKARIKYKKYCSHCGKEVSQADIIKGYELLRYQNNSYYSDVLVIPINIRYYLQIKHYHVQIS